VIWQIADVMNAIRLSGFAGCLFVGCVFCACTSSTQVRSLRDLYAPHVGSLQQDQKGEQLPVDDKSALVFFMRSSSLFSPNYSFFVDNTNPANELGYCNSGEYLYFYLKPGRRKIIADSLIGSASLEIVLEVNRTYFIQHDSIGGLLADSATLYARDENWGKRFLKQSTAGRVFKQEEDGVIPGEAIQEERIRKEIISRRLLEVGRVFSRTKHTVDIMFHSGLGDYASSELVTKNNGKDFVLHVTTRFHSKVRAKVAPSSPVAPGDKVYAKLK
jgi:hypothetical protein